MPSRVVVVNDFAHVQGGAARVAIETAIGLASRIREVVFLAGCGPADPRMAEAGVQVEVLDLVPANRDPSKLRGLRRGLWDRSVARAVEALLPDPANSLVHFHTFTDCLTASAPWAAERSGAAVLYTLHDYNFGCPYGGFYNYTLHRPCGRVGLSMRCLGTNCNRGQLANRLWRLGRLQTQRLRGVPSPTSGFVFISSFQRRRLEPYLPPESPRFELSNPVSIERSDPSDPGATDIFTFVGRLTPEKGPVDFANAAREARVRARFVGDGPLAEHVREANPEAEMAGWQHEDEVQRLMRASRAIVMPSRWFEGQPLVALEAAALGLPLVVSSWCAGSEMIEDGVTGLVYDPDDRDGLRFALEQMTDPALAREMGAETYRRFWARPWGMDVHLDALLDIYCRMLQGRSSR